MHTLLQMGTPLLDVERSSAGQLLTMQLASWQFPKLPMILGPVGMTLMP
jgi:hypothetical protein